MSFIALLPVAGCKETPPELGGETESDDGPCMFESDCEHMGPGHMCMDGMCMGMDVMGPEVHQPPPSELGTGLVRLTDLDPDPAVFEATMVAAVDTVVVSPPHETDVYVYKESMQVRGTIPGPFIDVEVGTLVRIHFTNRLPEPTTVHWHGLRLPGNMDGVPDLSQPPIPPGGTYTYEFTVLDPALFWYHPHVRSDVQVERGLYGLLRVRAKEEPAVNAERVFTLDDILLDEDGQIVPRDEDPAHYLDPEKGMMMTFTSMMGRQGNRLLLNGRANPIIHVKPGHVERWRFANTSNSRFFKLRLEDHKLVLIGVDGGLIPNPVEKDEILVPNAERVDVLIRFNGAPGSKHILVNTHHDRGHDLGDPGDLPLAQIVYDPVPADDALALPITTRSIERMEDIAATHHLVLGERMAMFDKVEFTINDYVWEDVYPAYPEQGSSGEYEVWELENVTHMGHPFHLHGVFFQPLSRKVEGSDVWTPAPQPMWKDTVLVPGESSLRFGVRYDGFPGNWIFHCHIFEHAHGGMMGWLRVDPSPNYCMRESRRCLGDFLQVCDEAELQWVPETQCAGGCVEVGEWADCALVCDPDDLRCEGDDWLDRCDPDGQAWSHAEFCEAGCDHVSGVAACVPMQVQVCAPGETRCAGADTIEQCNSEGMAWEVGEVCAFGCHTTATEAICYPVCRPGALACDIEEVKICNDTGDGFHAEVHCPGGCCELAQGSCAPVKGLVITPEIVVGNAEPTMTVELDTRDQGLVYESSVCHASWDATLVDAYKDCSVLGVGGSATGTVALPGGDPSSYVGCVKARDGDGEAVYDCCYNPQGHVLERDVEGPGRSLPAPVVPGDFGGSVHAEIRAVRVNGGGLVGDAEAGGAVEVALGFGSYLHDTCGTCAVQVHVDLVHVAGPGAANQAEHLECLVTGMPGREGASVGDHRLNFLIPSSVESGEHVYALALRFTSDDACSDSVAPDGPVWDRTVAYVRVTK